MAKRRKAKARRDDDADGERARVRPAARAVPVPELDFHGRPGLVGQTVHHEVLAFVARCKASGVARARIITGKGLHSAGAPVVRPQVERTLRRLLGTGEIRMFQTERLDAGGDGALRVDL